MPGNEKNTGKRWVDPDDAPEWSKDVFERAARWEGGKLVQAGEGTLTRRGRPKLENPKRQITLRLDSEVVDGFRETGPGWQGRINEALRKAMKL
jgi:uncharacterized protein (DUF4415 family)